MEIKEKLKSIIKDINNYNKYILEYGYNKETDIFINKNIEEYLNFLDECEKKINDEKK
jgi:hypothetical protein